MTSDATSGRGFPGSIRGVIDIIFGRWPAWPWSVLAVIAIGGVAGAASARIVFDSGRFSASASGPFACAAYGIVAAALLTLLPRLWQLLRLQPQVVRRPATPDESWWPLELLAAALRSTPTSRRTHEEFHAAIAAAVGEARTVLAERLWPAWVAAFVAPVFGLLAAWTSGAQVVARIGENSGPDEVLPAFLAVVSPPMVATIAASLVLMLAVVVTDQLTKRVLVRWGGSVHAADGDHPAVRERLDGSRPASRDDEGPSPGPAHGGTSGVASGPRPRHPLHPDTLEQMVRDSMPQRDE